MKAVHFGAGNIGRGFVGLLLNEAGYEVIFADVADALIQALKDADSYVVHEVGDNGKDHVVTGFGAINSATEADALTAAIAEADIVTTAVGPSILPLVAPAIRAGIDARDPGLPKVAVMACENAINATDILEAAILGDEPGDVPSKAIFANTAVDRIVPGQAPGAGLDVSVEPYHEWAIESPAFGGNPPAIPGAHFVDSLGPYIERKLFTVNTGHAATAYHGYLAGVDKISDVLANDELRAKVYAVLQETKSLLVAKYGFEPEVHEEYVQKILGRFANPYLPDTVQRVGRAPLRKVSRHERFIGPAAELAERGMSADALLGAVHAALLFNVDDDPEAAKVQEILVSHGPAEAASALTGLEVGHPLFAGVVEQVEKAKALRAE